MGICFLEDGWRWCEPRLRIEIDPSYYQQTIDHFDLVSAAAMQSAVLHWAQVVDDWAEAVPRPVKLEIVGNDSDLKISWGANPFDPSTLAVAGLDGNARPTITFFPLQPFGTNGSFAQDPHTTRTGYDVESILLHELGQVLGLTHGGGDDDVMHASGHPNQLKRRLTGADQCEYLRVCLPWVRVGVEDQDLYLTLVGEGAGPGQYQGAAQTFHRAGPCEGAGTGADRRSPPVLLRSVKAPY
ncbi:hypothetical protein IV102_10345 [bacterium]|nr:hypothetical protein [bacterium]